MPPSPTPMAGRPTSPTTRSWPGSSRSTRSASREEKRGLVRWLRPDYQIPRFAKGADKQAAAERGRAGGRRLIPAVEQKPRFRPRRGANRGGVRCADGSQRAARCQGLAAQFKRTKTTERKVAEVLASLARLGYVTTEDGEVVRASTSGIVSHEVSTASSRQWRLDNFGFSEFYLTAR